MKKSQLIKVKLNLIPDNKVYQPDEIFELTDPNQKIYTNVPNGMWELKVGNEVNFKLTSRHKKRPVKFIGFYESFGRSGVFQFMDTKNTFVCVDALTQVEQIVK